jgi:hypothetical protein
VLREITSAHALDSGSIPSDSVHLPTIVIVSLSSAVIISIKNIYLDLLETCLFLVQHWIS